MNASWSAGQRPKRFRLAAAAFATAIVVGTAACGSSSNSDTSSAGNTSNSAAVQRLLKEGIQQANSKLLNQAQTTFDNVLVLQSNNVFALYNLGVINQTKGNDGLAVSYYDKALSADGTYTSAMYNKAIILESSDLNGALSLYEQIVSIDPHASTAYLRMAFVYAKEGQTAKANAARTKAIHLDPSLAQYPLPAQCTPNC